MRTGPQTRPLIVSCVAVSISTSVITSRLPSRSRHAIGRTKYDAPVSTSASHRRLLEGSATLSIVTEAMILPIFSLLRRAAYGFLIALRTVVVRFALRLCQSLVVALLQCNSLSHVLETLQTKTPRFPATPVTQTVSLRTYEAVAYWRFNASRNRS